MNKHKKFKQIISYTFLSVLLCAVNCSCGTNPSAPLNQIDNTTPPTAQTPTPSVPVSDLRDNTSVCLVPAATGQAETHNDVASIDYSNASEGYIGVKYSGSCPKVKIRVTGSDQIIYTYDSHSSEYEFFPLSSGDGNYEIAIYENVADSNYSTCLFETISVTITNELGPALYPNQYVNFSSSSKAVEKAKELVSSATSDLEAITAIYDYITTNISYDYDKASDPPSGYVSDVDLILDKGSGICLDYAALMAAMLRSQRIPTRLEVGYAQDAYHAWISVYVSDVGWLNGVIEFDGDTWTLVDPTFGANTADSTLKKFIGDGTNYTLQRIY